MMHRLSDTGEGWAEQLTSGNQDWRTQYIEDHGHEDEDVDEPVADHPSLTVAERNAGGRW